MKTQKYIPYTLQERRDLLKKILKSYAMDSELLNIDMEYISAICQLLSITNYTINPDDLSLDVYQNVNLNNLNLNYIPLRFNIVYGTFNVANNNLTSLKNGPKYIKRLKKGRKLIDAPSYFCQNNQLTSLQYSPEIIPGHFYCFNNQITVLTSAPSRIGLYFNCSFNPLQTLEGCTVRSAGSFIYMRLKNSNSIKLTLEELKSNITAKTYVLLERLRNECI